MSDDTSASSPQSLADGIPVRRKVPDSSDDADQVDEEGSLLEDVSSLYENGKTYLTSELAFQKTRARYVAQTGPKIAVMGVAAALIALVALIALAVGSILALETLVGPLAATLIVVAVLLVAAGILAYMAKNKAAQMSRAMSGGDS